MSIILEYAFRSFWHFIGVLMLLALATEFIRKLWYDGLRHLTILVRGYPPAHCDADGDPVETMADSAEKEVAA